MAYDGSGNFLRTPGTRIANGGALVSAQVNDETDNIISGFAGKVNLDGKLAMTGLQLLSGDGTNVLHAATVKQAQQGILSKASAVGGTVDAITITMSPASTAWVTKETFEWISGGANTVTTPTINKDGLGAKTIVSATGGALTVGALGVSGVLNRGYYDGTNVRLIASSPFTGGTLTSTTSMSGAAFNETATTIATATTMNIGAAAANNLNTTGTITCTAFDTIAAGTKRQLRHGGISQFTHNATSMICLGGVNFISASGDVTEWTSLGSGNWYMSKCSKADGTAVVAAASGGWTNLGTQTTPSGSSQSLSGLTLTGYKFVKIVFSGVVKSGGISGLKLNANAVSTTTAGTYNGWIEVDLAVGTFVSFVNILGGSAISVFSNASGLSTASTAVTITTTTDTFNGGSFTVYGGK